MTCFMTPFKVCAEGVKKSQKEISADVAGSQTEN